mmetsp:Transcript_7132/g.14072  ORF Transcript_7132/g.14072 Transcript_7132/m.14072 type:complete len:242 (-) Transcript_7132:121-846(-)
MMMTVFLKDTVRPCESVIRPSSSTCNIRLKTSTCAFSISSKSTTLYGRRCTASVSCPPSSKPTYPGGAPIKRLTACFSMYSVMSRRIKASSLLKRYDANALANSVLPTPVGPRNINDAIGPLGSARSARLRWIASATAVTASSWPMTRRCNSDLSPNNRSLSEATSLVTGIPVHRLITPAMSASVTQPSWPLCAVGIKRPAAAAAARRKWMRSFKSWAVYLSSRSCSDSATFLSWFSLDVS